MTDSNQNNDADRTANSSMTQRDADAPVNGTRASSDAQPKAPTITEQIYSFFQRERADRGYCVYRPSLHRANIEPLDQLLGPAGKEEKDKD